MSDGGRRRKKGGLFSGPGDDLLGGMGSAVPSRKARAPKRFEPLRLPKAVLPDTTESPLLSPARVRIGARPDETDEQEALEALEMTEEDTLSEDSLDQEAESGPLLAEEDDAPMGSGAALTLIHPDGTTLDELQAAQEALAHLQDDDEDALPELPSETDFLRVAMPVFGEAAEAPDPPELEETLRDEDTERPGAATIQPAALRVAPPTPAQEREGGLLGLVQDNGPVERIPDPDEDERAPRYTTGRDEVDASIFFGGDDGVFDLSRQSEPEPSMRAEEHDEPSDLVDLDALPRAGAKVVVRDEVSLDGFRTTQEAPQDAGVWQPKPEEHPLPSRPQAPRNRAWWEERAAAEDPQKKSWKTPETLDLRGQTREEREAARNRRLATLATLAVLAVIVGALLAQKAGVLGPREAPLVPVEQVPEEPPPEEAPPEETPPEEAPPEEAPPPVEERPVEQVIAEDPPAEAVPVTGLLRVTATPSAVIYVDRKRKGSTPLDLELEPGSYNIKAVAPGRSPRYQTVRVDGGEATTVEFSF